MTALHIVFRVGEAEYVLPTAEVIQLETFTGATPVPDAAPFVAGIVQVRGKVMPAIDLRRRFGLPSVERTLDTRVVIGEWHGRLVALVVDASRDVVRLEPEQFSAPPALVTGRDNAFVSSVAHVGSRIFLRLNLENILDEEHGHG